MRDQWYFAYGSNLCPEQKVARTDLPIREARRARLDGHRIIFNKRGDKDGSGKANIVLDEDAVVWGVVYRCTPEALDKMDSYEVGYHRKLVCVRGDGDEEIKAITYISTKSEVAGQRNFIDDSLGPTKKYLETILQGARYHKLPDAYIEEIKRVANRD